MVRTLCLFSALSLVASTSFAAAADSNEQWICRNVQQDQTQVQLTVQTPSTEENPSADGEIVISNSASGLKLQSHFRATDLHSRFVRTLVGTILSPNLNHVGSFRLNKATGRLEFSGASQLPFVGLFDCELN